MSNLISIFLPNLEGGGTERVVVNLANAFVERGHAVEIVLMSATGPLIADLSPKVQIVDLAVPRTRWLLPKLVCYFRKARPTVMLACMWPLTVIAVLARALARVPTHVVVAEHVAHSYGELPKKKLLGLIMRSSMRIFLSRASGIVAVSKGVADDLASFAKIDINRIAVIYNPVSVSMCVLEVVPDHPLGWVMGAHKKILAVGTLKLQKDYPSLLQAFALLCRTVDARLLILGEGQCRTELELLSKSLKIESKVFMPGFVKDTKPYFQRADLHVLSSTHEGFGMVIVEALSVGTPVVSTDCPAGPREILADGKFGRLVPVADSVALASAMVDSLAAEHDCNVLKTRAQDFSIDIAVDRYLSLLIPDSGKPMKNYL